MHVQWCFACMYMAALHATKHMSLILLNKDNHNRNQIFSSRQQALIGKKKCDAGVAPLCALHDLCERQSKVGGCGGGWYSWRG